MKHTAYVINHWDRFHENAQSKKAKNLGYRVTPYTMNSGAHAYIMQQESRFIVYTLWNMLLELAAQCPQRGLLADTSGPISSGKLAYLMRLEEADIEEALEVLTHPEVSWVKEIECPRNLIPSGRSTRSARRWENGPEPVELESIEEGPELYAPRRRVVVDHTPAHIQAAPESTIETPEPACPSITELPPHPMVDHPTETPTPDVVDHASTPVNNVADHTTPSPKTPPRRHPDTGTLAIRKQIARQFWETIKAPPEKMPLLAACIPPPQSP